MLPAQVDKLIGTQLCDAVDAPGSSLGFGDDD